MNAQMADMLALEAGKEPFHHIHGAGKSGYAAVMKALAEKGVELKEHPALQVREYIYDMAPVMRAADLVICRAGASTVSELTALGMPRTLRAWAFLPEMAALTVVHPSLLTDVTHGLYPLMARRAQLTPCAVERRLRLAIESTWNRGDYDAIARFFGQSVDPERGKPTNREFLCQLQERLTLSARRMERRVG